MTLGDWDQLATYNAERSRGIVHTAEYDARMVELQRRFDEEQATRWGVTLSDGVRIVVVTDRGHRRPWWRFKQ